ncbi:response regulator [Paenibacillus sp. GSMTC-2017]|uniref:response regulator n=1 Tax=Paenibacillus sp. GSMTC-2017 TaxID=2794350 RepID=UPI0018D91222|nr:response regulator [Paenibacillus sp. GSMTC-2017]MBH5318672.1 response regulator [Paenibacillus sp. GSMTC-2017]
MDKISLRTKGLILILSISFIPLFIAGVNNYWAVKEAMIQSEIEKISSKQKSQANNIAAWMDIRRAEMLVMSRTSVIRFGTNEERLNYLGRELFRSGFNYHSLGFIDVDGNAYRSDGRTIDMSGEPFFQSAIEGTLTITDPYKPGFSYMEQTFIVVPVYGSGTDIVGVFYGSIPFTAFNRFLDYGEEDSPVRFYNDNGKIIYSSSTVTSNMKTLRANASFKVVAEEMLSHNEGNVVVRVDDENYRVYFAKVAGTPWRLALQEPTSKMDEMLAPIFWRMVITIAITEFFIALLFYLYFERIVKRLERILSVTEQAAGGEFKAEHLDTSQNDEIGQLAHSVNGMMEHLQEMFDRLNAIINQNQNGFVVLDNQYKVTYMNKAAEDMLGYKTEELAGHVTPLLFMDMDEIKAEAERLTIELGREVQPGLEVFKELRIEGFTHEREWTFIHKDGTRIPTLHSSNVLRDRSGKFSGVVGMIRDISYRKRVERVRNRLLDIVETAKDLIASVSNDGKFIYINKAGKEMLSLVHDDETNSFVKQYVGGSLYKSLLAGARIATEHGYWESEAQLLKLNGEQLYVSIVVVTHVDSTTGEMFFSCIARDISEQKRVQEELVGATLDAEEANKAKSRFLALMSHEIRTPLNGIIGLTQLIRKTELSVIQKDYLDKMNMSSETLLRIINDVLDFSKIEAGKIEVERLPFQPEELLHRLSNGLSVFLGGKEQFEFMIKTPEKLPLMLIGDSMRLEQVLLNLCMNAIKFTSKGLVKLELDIVEESSDKVKILFLISDTGIGMNQELLDQLFMPFTQADSSTTRKYGGTGLGLVISKNLVELMGGKLFVSSEEGVGSRFYFTLSFAADPYRYDPHNPNLSFAQDGTVWVVEDDKKMQEHWIYLFKTMGLSVIAFDSWQSSLEKLRRVGVGARPQLLLMDMEMSDMYGIHTWLSFQQEAEEAGVPIIALTTTYGRDELQGLSEEVRPQAILTKPVVRGAIVRALGPVFRKRAEEQQNKKISKSTLLLDEKTPSIKILLAEDNKINQLVALEMLKECGYEVGLAQNGEEVLRMLEGEHWDLIMMDIHMPIMDGTEAVRIIRSKEQDSDIPIVAVTANVVKKDHEHYLKLGMNDVITKPLEMSRLREVLTYWLDKMSKHSKQNMMKAEGFGVVRAEQPIQPLMSNDLVKLSSVKKMDAMNALERVNGKLPILLHMIEQFKLDYSTFIDQLRIELKKLEIDSAARMLHTLKGAAGYLSARSLGEAASEAETILKSGGLGSDELETRLTLLENELTELLAELRHMGVGFDK